jgi:hypothetical protein
VGCMIADNMMIIHTVSLKVMRLYSYRTSRRKAQTGIILSSTATVALRQCDGKRI